MTAGMLVLYSKPIMLNNYSAFGHLAEDHKASWSGFPCSHLIQIPKPLKQNPKPLTIILQGIGESFGEMWLPVEVEKLRCEKVVEIRTGMKHCAALTAKVMDD